MMKLRKDGKPDRRTRAYRIAKWTADYCRGYAAESKLLPKFSADGGSGF
jgi:hypothetical protein